MKTALQVLSEFGFVPPDSAKQELEQAMRTYAEQAIDRCAELKQPAATNNGFKYTVKDYVSIENIMKVKSELK